MYFLLLGNVYEGLDVIQEGGGGEVVFLDWLT